MTLISRTVRMKLPLRLAAVASFTCLCILILLLIETELNLVENLPETSNFGDNRHQHPVFNRRFLNREESSRISGESGAFSKKNVLPPKQDFVKTKKVLAKLRPTPTMETSTSIPTSTPTPRDNFTDLFKYTMWAENFRQFLNPPRYVLPSDNPTLQDVLQIDTRDNLTNWEKFHLQISKLELYPEDGQAVDGMLHDIATQKIVAIEQFAGGTQLKLAITFENGGQALFKPMRFPRETETLPNHFYFSDYERHNSEIAAYHLDRLMGFRHAPPVIGRLVNLTSEIYPLADEDLLKTFFISPAGNVCFHGQCKYYCDTSHALCGHPDTLEGSFAAFIPPESIFHRHAKSSPWRRSYNKRKKAVWETDNSYCQEVRKKPMFETGRRLYDLMDLSAFDFIIGNMDRHHFEEVLLFGNDSALIHWDHGRGFGRPNHDEFSILAPVLQCCLFRISTFNRLYEFHNGPLRLSELMAKAMASDPIAPILTYGHLKAMDRRVEHILGVLRKCLMFNHPRDVFLDDLPSDQERFKEEVPDDYEFNS